jgi:hypothetical protein
MVSSERVTSQPLCIAFTPIKFSYYPTNFCPQNGQYPIGIP